ncbi:hypothetical protein [Frankia gtarii]|uniref:hypothetical protein n=1 Tax=Frankia gtarii TaxID=2950102 RepID=UPI0021BFFB10|nr:hypothetical protein [Frankia gtarii]
MADILARELNEPISVHSIWPGRGTAATPGPAKASPSLMKTAKILHDLSTAGYLIPTSGGRCEFVEADTAIAALDWLNRSEAHLQSKTGGEDLDPQVIDILSDRVDTLRHLDDLHGASFVLGLALQDLRWTLLRAQTSAYGREDGIRLHRVISELTQLVGWLALDGGDYAQAQFFFLAALRAARIAEDRLLGAYILSCMGYQSVWTGNAEHAMRLLQTACIGTSECSRSTVRALLFSRLARGHALLGDGRACEKAIASSEQAWGNREDLAGPRWCYWVDSAALLGDAGRAKLDLGQRRAAETDLERALRMLGDSQTRNRSLHLTSLAEIRIASGDVDGAAAVVLDAVALLDRIDSVRTRCRLQRLEVAFTRHRGYAVAEEATEAIGSSLTRAGSG